MLFKKRARQRFSRTEKAEFTLRFSTYFTADSQGLFFVVLRQLRNRNSSKNKKYSLRSTSFCVQSPLSAINTYKGIRKSRTFLRILHGRLLVKRSSI